MPKQRILPAQDQAYKRTMLASANPLSWVQVQIAELGTGENGFEEAQNIISN